MMYLGHRKCTVDVSGFDVLLYSKIFQALISLLRNVSSFKVYPPRVIIFTFNFYDGYFYHPSTFTFFARGILDLLNWIYVKVLVFHQNKDNHS